MAVTFILKMWGSSCVPLLLVVYLVALALSHLVRLATAENGSGEPAIELAAISGDPSDGPAGEPAVEVRLHRG